MDNLTHALFGFFIALLLAKKLGFDNLKWPVIAGIVAAEIPDIDTLALLINESGFYTYHRVATHSFIGIILLSLVVAVIFSRLKKQAFMKYLLLALAATFSHILLDVLTPAAGVQLFFPFSNIKVALNFVPSVDVYLLAILAAGLMVIAVHKLNKARVAAFVILFSLLFICARIGLGAYVDMRVNHINGESFISPDYFNPLKWFVINENTKKYTLSEYNIVTGMSPAVKEMEKDSDARVEASKKAKIVKSFMGYARFPVAINDGNMIKWFDLRQSVNGESGFSASVLLDENMNILEERMGI